MPRRSVAPADAAADGVILKESPNFAGEAHARGLEAVGGGFLVVWE